MKHLRLTALSLSILALAACQTFEGVKKDLGGLQMPSMSSSSRASSTSNQLVYSGGCPQVEAVEELSSISEFSNLSDTADHNLVSRTDITNIQNTCNYDERSVTIDLRMDFAGTLGPQARAASGQKPFFSHPFFVAITSDNGDILAKEIFAASLTYPAGADSQTYTERLRQVIPIDNRDRGANYKVLVGFQLTPDQLAYNRKKLAEVQIMRAAEQNQPPQFQQQTQDMQEQVAKDSIYIGRPVDITP